MPCHCTATTVTAWPATTPVTRAPGVRSSRRAMRSPQQDGGGAGSPSRLVNPTTGLGRGWTCKPVMHLRVMEQGADAGPHGVFDLETAARRRGRRLSTATSAGSARDLHLSSGSLSSLSRQSRPSADVLRCEMTGSGKAGLGKISSRSRTSSAVSPTSPLRSTKSCEPPDNGQAPVAMPRVRKTADSPVSANQLSVAGHREVEDPELTVTADVVGQQGRRPETPRRPVLGHAMHVTPSAPPPGLVWRAGCMASPTVDTLQHRVSHRGLSTMSRYSGRGPQSSSMPRPSRAIAPMKKTRTQPKRPSGRVLYVRRQATSVLTSSHLPGRWLPSRAGQQACPPARPQSRERRGPSLPDIRTDGQS